ncbi:GumC family protein [Candidatus Nitrosacidococcus tergens]|uniref:non-specific protein-tyrosine kinase n=1 Tax=Candidatus Nitrosacidococcus tergens TaxID=553981 RepID=A0A7G1Q998_9GAMM|nr:polysaccharide biosynthesis tyrosine autokinase [Candidatus Nitrosacidococcus tergens]CAB1275785.1 Protein-tyrosine kinase [Candidatus Nitrosacidococcus tergens]
MNHEEHSQPISNSGSFITERDLSSFALSHERIHPQGDEDEIHLSELWHILVRRKWTIFVFFLVVTIIGMTASFLMTPIYRSGVTLLIDPEGQNITDYHDVLPTESAASRDDFYQTQYGLLKSYSLTKRVFQELELADHPLFAKKEPSFIGKLKGFIKNLGKAEDADEEEDEDLAIEKLITEFQEGFTIAPVKNSRLVGVYYDSPDPKLSTQVVSALSQAFINTNLERRYEASAYARDFLKDRLLQIKARLEEAEEKLVEYGNSHEIIDVGENQSQAANELQKITLSLALARESRARTEATYQQMLKTSDKGLSRILQDPMIRDLQESLAKIENEYAENLNIYKPDYPKMVQLRKQADKLKEQIQESVQDIKSAITADREEAIVLEQTLEEKSQEIKAEIKDLARRNIQYQVLKREADTSRQLYEGLLQRYKEVGVSGGIGSNNISVVDPPKIPIDPYKPKITLNTLLAMFLGLFGGLGLAFLFEHLDDTLKRSEDIEKTLGLHTLGIIPLISTKELPDEQSPALINVLDKRSALAEAYRSLRTALQFATSTGAPKKLQITSTSQGEGKSTSAVSLAIQFAQAGQKTLIIDGDLRNPSLHRIFEMDNSVGLTNYLAGNASPAEISQGTIVPNLFMISSGPLPPDPAELLGSAKMISLLSIAQEKFDHIIIDSPPVLGLADALIIGNLVEATLFVVAAGQTRKAFAQGALKRLKAGKSKVIGGILDKFDSKYHGYGYSYDYSGYHYSYGTDEAYDYLSSDHHKPEEIK